MSTNEYDNPVFFKKYSEMSRSKEGLAGAGEWPTLEKLLPEFKDKKVLDLGSGYGWHCVYAAENGASSVIGVESSKKMIEVAETKSSFSNITYMNRTMEDLDFPAESFDIILRSLAIHYIDDYEKLVQDIYKMLKKGGKFIFTVEHPVFTAQGPQDWYYNENGEIEHFPVDNYFYEGKREAIFLDEKVVKYHRTLTTYLDTLLTNGFTVEKVVEPKPPEDMIEKFGMVNEMRRPMMLIISVEK